jgi:sulfur carrier protein
MDEGVTTGTALRISVNGRPTGVAPGATVLDAARGLGIGDDERGVAIALDGLVVRRADWVATPLADGARLEVVRAAAGG